MNSKGGGEGTHLIKIIVYTDGVLCKHLATENMSYHQSYTALQGKTRAPRFKEQSMAAPKQKEMKTLP